MTTKQIIISTRFVHKGHVKHSFFEGFAYIDSGFLAGGFVGPANPEFAEATLMTAFTLTGCPIAARTASPQLNPWRKTNGSYRGERTLEMRGLFAKSILTSEGFEDRVDMQLQVDVEGQLPDLVSVDKPFQEHIHQLTCGVLEGYFEFDFLDKNGHSFPTIARTSYTLSIDSDVADAWRNITILGHMDRSRFHQIEQIDLFSDKSAADADLAAKCQLSLLRNRPLANTGRSCTNK